MARPSMNTAVKILLFVIVSTACHAATDSQRYPSPDGAFSIINVGDSAQPDHHFQIRDRDGHVLLSSDAHPSLESGGFATSIRWSPNSAFVALSVRTSGPYIQDAFVYSTVDRALLRLSTDDSDYQTAPLRWSDAHTLILQTSTPVGGKASDDRPLHRYRRTVRLHSSPLRYEVIRTSPRSTQ
jgi:hypothetical protein